MTEADPTLAALIERLSAGEPIDPSSIPESLRNHPDVVRLVALARVMGQLDANLASLDDADAPPPATNATAPDRLGPFRLVRVLGTGGMGEVWLGERADGEVEQRVAVKRVRGGDRRFAERLREERRLLARLEHPNIARFIDAGVDAAGTPWLALEYVDGVPITDWCRERDLGLADRLRLFIKVCAAVEHAHRHLVVHRDLKPSNILVNADGEPKLLDFGIAKLVDGSIAEATQTALTPAYAAPEQLRGGAISTATDVYALGLVLFRLIAGSLPETRTGENLAQVLARLDDEETERPSRRAAKGERPLPYPAQALSGDLDAIVAQALRADPARRYGSAAALAEDLERHLDARPVLAREPTRWYRAGRFIRRHRVAVAFASLAAIALVTGTAVALEQARRATLEAVRADAEAAASRAALARAERGQRFLADLFAGASPEAHQGRMPTARDLIADGERRLMASDLPDADRADLLLTIARSWNSLGEPETALRTLAVAARTVPDDQHLLIARMAVVLGRIELLRGKHDAARQHFTHGAILAAAVGPGAEAESIAADFGLAQAATYGDQPSEALALSERAFTRAAEVFGPDHRETLDAGMALGTALLGAGRLDEAIERLELTAAAADRVLGVPNAVTCRSRHTLSGALDERGDYQRALAAGVEGARICLAVFGPDHWRYGRAEFDVGIALMRLGRIDESIARFEISRRAFAAAGHFDEASARRLMGVALLTAERWAEAAPALAEAEAMLAARMGAESSICLATRLNRAFALNELGQSDEAVAMIREVQATLSRTLPPEHDLLRYALRVLAIIHRKQRRYDEALAEVDRLIELERRGPGDASPSFAVAQQQLARTLMARNATGDREKALEPIETAIAILSRPGGSPTLLAGALLDRADLNRERDPEAARQDREAAARALAEVPTVPPSIQRRLAGN
jgi:serine/threonine-protein kinase